MRLLLASTAILALSVAASAGAQTVIDTRQTTAVRTATARGGAADNVSIAAAGSVTPASGNAVTIDSDNSVTNAGTIQVTGANDANGILAQAGVRGGITNTGKIIVDEAYTATDGDTDGDLDGPFAQGARRAGIRTAGAFTGAIAHSGEIMVEGQDSTGIVLGGPLTGAFTTGGTTSVTGDRSTGVQLQAVTGAVTLGGTITALGQGAVGARLNGDVTGAVVIEGAIAATGYRYTAPPAGAKLDADDLLQGGSALIVGGNVTGGVTLSNTSGKAADVTAYGGAPAMLVGSATRAVTIGPVAGTTPGPGLVLNGRVTGSGLYSGIAATGLQVGGLGGAVTIANGISVGGTVQAGAVAADATAIRIGAGAQTPVIQVTGSVAATGGTGAQAIAVLIDTGAAVPTVRNSGAIVATAGNAAGAATAILDRTGGVTLVENAGSITASGADAIRNVAIDLSTNSGGTTVKQIAGASGAAAPTITGAIRFGSGNDTLDIGAGTVTGDVAFGAGSNRLTMAGASSYSGKATFGSGADSLAIGGTARFGGTADFAGGGQDVLTIADKGVFAGKLANAGAVAVTVAAGGGTFAVDGGARIGSLTLGTGSILSVALDKANPTANLIQVGGATTIGADSKLALRVTGGADIAGRYVVLQSGTLSGTNNLSLADQSVPFLYKSAIVATLPNEIAVDVTRKAKTELGFNRAQASAFDSIDAALGGDAKVAAAVRGLYDGAAFRAAVDQMLPNYAGGVFESVTLASRAVAGPASDPLGSYLAEGPWGMTFTPVGWDASKATRGTTSYDVRGWGLSGGVEHRTSIGNFGVTIAYLSGRDTEGVAVNRVDHDQYELAGSWRGRWGGFAASARGSAAFVSFDSVRQFEGTVGTETVTRRANGDWNGTLYTGSGTLSYEHRVGRITLRPMLAIDYYRLNEDAYVESGGDKAFDLTVRERRSDELAGTASVAAGLNFGGNNRFDQWSRIEVEGGRRQHLAGALGRTTASFGSGTAFTLDPEARDSGWMGKVRAITGAPEVRLSGEVGAEQRLGDVALSARAALQIAL
ncbi:autotransporter domain-containing protein [Sphingomonas arantia]|uniref:Autotransporter domain-containing protein n=1 Tax=Sphingomonas arantia TaxID=1460676 RepID=A0ABW4TS45_9SPHN